MALTDLGVAGLQVVHKCLQIVVAHIVAVADFVRVDQGVAAVEQEGRRCNGVVLLRIHGLAVDLDVQDAVATLSVRVVRVGHVVGQAHVQTRATRLCCNLRGLPLILQRFLDGGAGQLGNSDVVAERLDGGGLFVGHIALGQVRADTAGVHHTEVDLGVEECGKRGDGGLRQHVVRGGLGAAVGAWLILRIGATLEVGGDVGDDLLAELAGNLVCLCNDLLNLGIRGDAELLELRRLDLATVDLDELLLGLIVGESNIGDDLAVLVGLRVRNLAVAVELQALDVVIATEYEIDVLRVELRCAGVGRIVNQSDDEVSLAGLLELLGLDVDLLGGIRELHTRNVGRAGLFRGEVGGRAHQGNLHALLLHDGVRLHRLLAINEDVRAELLVIGARNDAVDQVLVALIELVVAHSGAVGADGFDEVHRVLVVGDEGNERRATLVVTGGGDDGVRVLLAQVVHDARDIGGTHLVAGLRGDFLDFLAILVEDRVACGVLHRGRGRVVLQATVEVGDVGNVDGDLVSLSCCSERCCGEHNCGRGGCGDQGASATEIKHGRLLGVGGWCPSLVSLTPPLRSATSRHTTVCAGKITPRAPTFHLLDTLTSAWGRVRGTFGRR